MVKKLLSLLLALCLLLALAACGKARSYEVRFELNGGTLVSGELLQTVDEGGAATAPETVREGYVFNGWSAPAEDVHANAVLVAQWLKTCTISFDPAGGEILAGETEQVLTAGAMPEAPALQRERYEFAGWQPELAAAESDTVYTALWNRIRYSAEDLYAMARPAVVELAVYDASGQQYALGSGFFIDDQGTLATNFHVVEGAAAVKAILDDDSSVDILAVKDYDASLDLALLQADVHDNHWLELAEADVRTGETIYALGSSMGLTGSFSSGIVSTASREIEGVNCVQITAPISTGNSGGPLVDEYGLVVGVNAMTLNEGQNLNFAINIKELEKLDRSGSVSMEDFYAATVPVTAAGYEQTGFFYDQFDQTEVESNDTLLTADLPDNGVWLAAQANDTQDLDWYMLLIEDPCTLSVEVAPYYLDDMEHLNGGLFALGEEDIEAIAVLEASTDGAFDESLMLSYRFDEAGIYFLVVFAEDDYTGSEPIYYALKADW